MQKTIVKFTVVIILVLTTGFHWLGLQAIAWTTMLAANLTTEHFATAVSDTFDGEHPCPLCKMIAANKHKQSDPKSDAAQGKFKFECASLAGQFVFIAPTAYQTYRYGNLLAPWLNVKPLLPPPRSLLA